MNLSLSYSFYLLKVFILGSLVSFFASDVFSAGLTIPANCTVNVSSCSLVVSGDITNSGTLTATTGTITLSGNWLSSGVFTSGTGTVTFNATSGTQTLNTGGLANAFYNLTHTGSGTVALSTNLVDINNSFSNTAGTFDANSINMTVAKDWTNTATFTPGTGTVTFDGTAQTITGSTTFYNLTKATASADTLTFSADGADETTVTHFLTLQGAASNLLTIDKTGANSQAKMKLMTTAAQSLGYLHVFNNIGTARKLVAGLTSTNGGNTTNWSFGNDTFVWEGTVSTDWDDPFNWDLGAVPAPGDTVTIAPIGGTVVYQPTLSTNVVVANLTLQAGSALTLNGRNLTVSTTFANSGDVRLKGSETLNITQDTANPGTFTYLGTNAGATITIRDFGASDYYNLVINDTNATPDTFITNGSLTLTGSLSVTASTLNTSTNSNAVVIAGSLTVNGGTWTATNSTIDVGGAVVVSSGVLTAPASTTDSAFTVGGNWTHSGGTFTANSGKVTLDGTNQTFVGDTTFYQLRKVVAAAATLTFPAGGTQTVTNDLTLSGASGQLLSIVSSSSPTQANLVLSSGGTQSINYVSVMDNNATGGVQLVARSSSVNAGNNTNWAFGGTTVTWTGTTSTDWDVATNWNLGLVPNQDDTAVVANAGGQPATLSTNVQLAALTVNSSATASLNGLNLVVSGVLTNNGTITRFGSETMTFGTMDTDSGTVTFTGDGDGNAETFTITDYGSSDYYNLVINDANGTKDTFETNGALTVNGALSVTAGTMNTSTNSNALVVNGVTTINGGTLTATNGTIDANSNVVISSGVLTAPGATSNTAFTVAGNWDHSGGTFTPSSGKVTFDGTGQSISGSTTFYRLRKVVAAADTLTLQASATQTVTNDLTLSGASGQLLSIVSSSSPTQANLTLQAGATQSITYVDVMDSNASGGIMLVARNSSVDSGNNTNWVFGATTITWVGTTSTDWDTATNWNLGLVPSSIDNVIINNAGSQPATFATDVTAVDMTVNTGAGVSLNAHNLTVTGTLSNTGTVTLTGSETVEIATVDTDSGTFTYTGNGGAGPFTLQITDPTSHNILTNEFYNLTINDSSNAGTFVRTANLNVLGGLTISGGTLDITTNAVTLTATGNIAVSAGTLSAANGNIDANSGVSISGTGTVVAPTTGKSFTIAGDFSHTAGTFTHSSGRVTLDTTTAATITGDTTFYDFYTTAAGKTISFTAGSNQTITHDFTFTGADTKITLQSTSAGNAWSLTFPNSAQIVSQLDVRDSNALTNTVSCLNCTDSGNNNANWLFYALTVTAPADERTVGQTPVIIGVGPADTNVRIRGKDTGGSDAIVATARTDSNGNFRVELGLDEDTDSTSTVAANTELIVSPGTLDNYLIPYILNSSLVEVPGVRNDITVVVSPTTAQVPQITTPANNVRINGATIRFIGLGKTGETVTLTAKDASGNLLLTTIGTDNTDASGNFDFLNSTALGKGINYVTATVDGVASEILTISLTDPFGVVFDSSSNDAIEGATVSIYRASDDQLAEQSICDANGNITTLKDLDCNDTNPFTTDSTGVYYFLTASGDYYMRVNKDSYVYPSQLTTFPTGRTVTTGSKGEQFTVANTVLEIDHPVDINTFLLRIEKDANKSEARVGDVVTYTVKIENISEELVHNFIISDRIPPGFKYLRGRVLYNGQPLADPDGNRPLRFNVPEIAAGATSYLRYQLVVGSGVLPGNYENSAFAHYASNIPISNTTTKTVKVVMDPLFDLGLVIGKVFYDLNENGLQDSPEYDATEGTTIIEKPVPNVQIMMEDGTVVTTDREGKFSVPGILPGRHILRVDERTLPPGTYFTTDKALIIDVGQGSPVKANFGINADNAQIVGRDAQFFNEKIALTQDRSLPAPRLNAAMFSQEDAQDKEELVLYNGTLVRPAQWRLFTNYSAFIAQWKLEILDQDTKNVVRRFEGNRLNFFDPIFWNGRDDNDKFIRADNRYAYVLTVEDAKGQRDTTREKPITLRLLDTEEQYKAEKDKEKDKEWVKTRVEKYLGWVDLQSAVNQLDRRGIVVGGETITINRQGQDIKSVRVMRGKEVFAEVPVQRYTGLTPQELLTSGASLKTPGDHIEFVLPNGDYTLEIVGPRGDNPSVAPPMPDVLPAQVPDTMPGPAPALDPGPSPMGVGRYSRPLKVGDDYLMFVGMGDAKIGYTFNRGDVETVQSNDRFQPGFWKEGKAAYYLKGKIKGKYLVTSSFDMDRDQKALFRKLDPDTYYPLYGDQSSINYDATDTQGPLYLLVQWDKSSAIWGNYAVDFNDTEFSAFSRNYYGGKIDYQSLSNNSYGDARSKVVVFHAEVQQRPAHNEFLGTGGSLYFLKHRAVVQGSDKIRIEVRDKITGLVITSKDMKNGADYELDEGEGRILFWQPVSMIAKSESVVSSGLLDGNPIYVVADYQYELKDKIRESSEGARVAQAVGDSVVVGGTYVTETQADKNFSLKGTDVTAHLGPDAVMTAEMAETESTGTNSYISTDGGITFTTLTSGNVESGKAYGIKGDARLFNRLGVSSYYKWIENTFSSPQLAAQQGKESGGLTLTFDVTPVTRITARQDIQRLINSGTLQTQAQVGASETSTTMVQIMHESEKLRLTGGFQIQEVKNRIGEFETSTNTVSRTLAGKGEYALNGRVSLTAGQQFDVSDPSKNITTVGVQGKVTENLTARVEESFSRDGTATTAGITQNVSDKLALSGAYTLAQKNAGGIDKTATVGAQQKINDQISTTATVAMTDSSDGTKTATGAFGTKAKLNDTTDVEAVVGKTTSAAGQQNIASVTATTQVDKDSSLRTSMSVHQDPGGGQSKSMALEASQSVDDKRQVSSRVQVDEDAQGGKTSSLVFSDKTKINDQLQAVNERTFSQNADGLTNDNRYALVREKDGRRLEGSLTRQLADSISSGVSQSNIFGLTGDVNDRLALLGTMERGQVQNLDGSRTSRLAFALGAGYVWKDTETALEKLKNSTKIELRLDKGGQDARQFVFYNALEGRITENWSVSAKLDYSKTINTDTKQIQERHKEIILGTAYRPVNFDNLNLIARYTYKDAKGPLGQANSAVLDVEQNRMQVFAAEAIYDFNESWQLAEKFALRINDEKVSGFEFNRTHTWLMIHRINYHLDRNWVLGGEYRKLTQVEARDSKQGLLLEATRTINDNAQLGVGWNFTEFSDDLTDLGYTSYGPFLRMTGKLYDRTPEEKQRARAKWLDERINGWAWAMVKRELSKPNSKVVGELNRMFAMANQAQKNGQLEGAQQVYKDIIMAGQMMYDEASEYIRRQIAFEEKLQDYHKTAMNYFSTGEYAKARKLWEKIVEDAQKRVVE